MSELRSHKRQREQLVRRLRAEGMSWVVVADVLRWRYRLNARVAFRYAHGWSQRRAADEWNRVVVNCWVSSVPLSRRRLLRRSLRY
jgi:DNA polymerase III delta subunit